MGGLIDLTKQDKAQTKIHHKQDTVIAALESLSLGEQESPSDKLTEMAVETATDETALAKRTVTQRHPSIKRMPHVEGVSGSCLLIKN
jgi:hypothetical protein